MAIVQVSKIQHRKGLQQDLPQLASAEFGWALDTRKLYIGNGLISEGAASEGITEILTQYSDLLNIAGAYTFRGAQSGYTSQTGVSALQPVQRSLQLKVDDTVNVRDFGAVGDSVTNDTAALQRAIDQVYFGGFSLTQPRLRRVINIPAGIYVIDSSLKLNSHVILRGEGKDRTIIRQTNASYPIFQLKDSNSQTDNLYGVGGGQLATNITVENMTVQHQQQKELVYFDTCSKIIFNGVKFVGASTPETIRANNSSVTVQNAVRLVPRTLSGTAGTGPTLGPISDIFFTACEFTQCIQGAVVNAVNVRFINCSFSELGNGVWIGGAGDTKFSSALSKSIKVINSYFDNVYYTGVKVDFSDTGTPVNVTTSNNHFAFVGYPPLEAGGLSTVPVASPIDFAAENCMSVGDTFDRPDSEIAAGNVTVQFSSILKNIALSANVGLTLGHKTIGTSTMVSFAAAQTSGNTGVVFTRTGNYLIDYNLSRGTTYRRGTVSLMVVKQSGTIQSIQYEDNYQEYPEPSIGGYYTYPGRTGATLTVDNDGSENAVWFATTDASDANDTNITYTITTLR